MTKALQRFGEGLARGVERVMPGPFIFAIILTAITWMLGVGAGTGPLHMVEHWMGGFWSLLTFAMQMVLILVCGYAIAVHPLVARALGRLAAWPRSSRQAVLLVTVVAMGLSWVNWGIGLIAGALLAREVGRRAREEGRALHYPLVVAAGYSGMAMIWHWGLSGSAPLLAASTKAQGNALFDVVGRTISTGETIFHPYALMLSGLSLAFTGATLALLAPAAGADPIPGTEPPDLAPEDETPGSGSQHLPSFAERADDSWILGAAMGLIGLAGIYVVVRAVLKSGNLNLNQVNFVLLFAGLLLYLRPGRYLRAFSEGISASAGIILLFPFYAGIMGMMKGSGLSLQIAQGMIDLSSAETLPLMAWLSAGLVNLFVPSGGGEWAVLGEPLLRAADAHGVPPGKVVIAFGAGDQWTNLFQPFWALPLLAVTGLKARQIFGYTLALMLLGAVFYGLALTFLPY